MRLNIAYVCLINQGYTVKQHDRMRHPRPLPSLVKLPSGLVD